MSSFRFNSSCLKGFLHTELSPFLLRLNGKHVVFGKVVEGIDVVKAIEKQGTKSGSPKAKAVIADSGELK